MSQSPGSSSSPFPSSRWSGGSYSMWKAIILMKLLKLILWQRTMNFYQRVAGLRYLATGRHLCFEGMSGGYGGPDDRLRSDSDDAFAWGQLPNSWQPWISAWKLWCSIFRTNDYIFKNWQRGMKLCMLYHVFTQYGILIGYIGLEIRSKASSCDFHFHFITVICMKIRVFFMFTKIEISKLLWKNQRCAYQLKYFSGYKVPNII